MTDEQISKVADLVIAQSNDLWPLALGLVITSFLILAQARPPRPSKWVVLAFWFVVVCGVLTLGAGYMLKGNVIQQLSVGTWNPQKTGLWSIIQLGLLSLSLVVFTVTFLCNREFCSKAIMKIFGS